VITERLLDHLSRNYQFLLSRSVTIADPSAGLEIPHIRGAIEEGKQLATALAGGKSLKADLLRDVAQRGDARDGITGQMGFEDSPYVITKNWARSVSELLRDRTPFGGSAWPQAAHHSSAADIAAGILQGDVPPLSASTMTLDIGFDVSRSMTIDGRADYAYGRAIELLEQLQSLFTTLSWRLWLVSDDDYNRYVDRGDGERPVNEVTDPRDPADIDVLITRSEEEIREVADRELQKVTDIAEAAHGAQLILTYFPLFALVTIDVYERYLGLLLHRGR
jgi:hypothetical protein